MVPGLLLPGPRPQVAVNGTSRAEGPLGMHLPDLLAHSVRQDGVRRELDPSEALRPLHDLATAAWSWGAKQIDIRGADLATRMRTRRG